MKLYFLRHAEAEEMATSDHERQLTLRGRERLATAARVIRKLRVKPARIYSSPRIRAQQTAEIVAQQLGTKIEIREEVNFGFNVVAVETLISSLSDDSEVMFVGHEPSFSMTVGELTGGTVEMKKGGLARVDLTAQRPLRGTLVWLITPGVFDMLNL
jgi:phosphohistidine phosphatase